MFSPQNLIQRGAKNRSFDNHQISAGTSENPKVKAKYLAWPFYQNIDLHPFGIIQNIREGVAMITRA